MAIESKPFRFNPVDRSDKRGSHYIAMIVFVLIFIGFSFIGFITLSNQNTFPIKQVYIEGEFTHVSQIELQSLVTNKVRGSFFSLDVDAVRLALLDEPWVSEVTVERIWPDTLKVMVLEQMPYVRWQETGLLNEKGERFVPERSTIPVDLPRLFGPAGAERVLFTRFNVLQKRVQDIGFKIASVTLNERRAWSFKLENGINVVLGRYDFEKRFERFLASISMMKSDRVAVIETMDMRYTNGFSIKWKKQT